MLRAAEDMLKSNKVVVKLARKIKRA
jgi:hypothetical protein